MNTTASRIRKVHKLSCGGGSSIFALAVLLFASITSAQTISSPTDGLYRPGRYMPLRIEASGAGLIQVRGDDVQGIDWDASGPASVIVPLMIYSDTTGELDLTVNGRPFKLPRRPMESGAPWPVGVEEIDPPQPGEPRMLAFSDAGYVPADSWTGGRAAGRRYAIVGAAIAVALLFAAVLTVRRPATRSIVAVIACVGVCVAVVRIFGDAPPDRFTVIVSRPGEGEQPRFDWWTYERSKATQAGHLAWWTESMPRVLMRTPTQLKQVSPVLECLRTGEPASIRFTLPADITVAQLTMNYVRPRRENSEIETSRELVRYAYGRRAVVENGLTVIR